MYMCAQGFDLHGLSVCGATCGAVQVVKLRSARALKLGCTTAVYHQEGKRVAAGGQDGSLHLIQLDRPHVKHDVVREAHPVSALFPGTFWCPFILCVVLC